MEFKEQANWAWVEKYQTSVGPEQREEEEDYKGMGWDGIEAESEPDVFSLDRIGGGCKKSRVQGVDLDGKRRIKDSVLTEVDSGANLKFSRW